jgi:hypothetical protein
LVVLEVVPVLVSLELVLFLLIGRSLGYPSAERVANHGALTVWLDLGLGDTFERRQG